MHQDVAIIVPVRLGSTRLPNKPLQIIGNQTMIEHVLMRIRNIKVRGIFVATDSKEIYSLVKKKGFSAIMTSQDCPSGTDRIYEAFKTLPYKEEIKYVINVQGDMPFIDEAAILGIINSLKSTNVDIMTSAVKISKDIAVSPSNVKVVIG